jgi:hypothetical protein
MIAYYRVGSHNARNIYLIGASRETDEQVGVMFTPEKGRLVVAALNAQALDLRAEPEPEPERDPS